MTISNDIESTEKSAEALELWKKFRTATREGGLSSDYAIDGSDANLIAAYVDGALSADEKSAVEQRLANDPVFLEAWLAAAQASAATAAGNVRVPRALKAWARGLILPKRPASTARAAADLGRQRGGVPSAWLGWPSVAWAVAAVLVLMVAAGGVYFLYTKKEEGTPVALKERPVKSEDIEKLGDRFLSDPAKVFFDGIELK